MKKLFFLYLLISSTFCLSQIGGQNSFSFLNRSFSAKSLSLGGSYASTQENQLQNAYYNPAILNGKSHHQISFNHLIQTGNVQNGLICYGFKNNHLNVNQNFSIRYINYGKMDETTETGEIIGTFSPGDFIFSSALSKSLNSHFQIGSQVNFIYSQYHSQSASGISFDFGGFYSFKDTTKTVSFVMRNMGIQFNSFTTGITNPLPFQFDMSFSHRLAHAPLRFSYLIHHVNKWDLSYYDPTIKGSVDPLTGDSILPKKTNFISKSLLHLTPQVQLYITKNIQINFAFDYFKRYQMSIISKPRLSGFSFGLSMAFKRFHIEYAYANYSAAGSINAISFTTNIDNWRKNNSN
jgi:hypothetical protein